MPKPSASRSNWRFSGGALFSRSTATLRNQLMVGSASRYANANASIARTINSARRRRRRANPRHNSASPSAAAQRDRRRAPLRGCLRSRDSRLGRRADATRARHHRPATRAAPAETARNELFEREAETLIDGANRAEAPVARLFEARRETRRRRAPSTAAAAASLCDHTTDAKWRPSRAGNGNSASGPSRMKHCHAHPRMIALGFDDGRDRSLMRFEPARRRRRAALRIDEFAPSAAIRSSRGDVVRRRRARARRSVCADDGFDGAGDDRQRRSARFNAVHNAATDGLTSTIQPSSAAVDFRREKFDVPRAALFADVHAVERARRKRAPHVEFSQQLDRRGIQRNGAHVESQPTARQRRFAAIREHHRKSAPRERQCRGRADQAAAGDQHRALQRAVVTLAAGRASPLRCRRCVSALPPSALRNRRA